MVQFSTSSLTPLPALISLSPCFIILTNLGSYVDFLISKEILKALNNPFKAADCFLFLGWIINLFTYEFNNFFSQNGFFRRFRLPKVLKTSEVFSFNYHSLIQ